MLYVTKKKKKMWWPILSFYCGLFSQTEIPVFVVLHTVGFLMPKSLNLTNVFIQQQTSGADLALLMLDVLEKSKAQPTDSMISRIAK